MHNEFITLTKISAWSTPTVPSANTIEAAVSNSQGLMISKILAGKLYEGWQLMHKAYFSSKLSLVTFPRLLHQS